jgi:hypothetical protein
MIRKDNFEVGKHIELPGSVLFASFPIDIWFIGVFTFVWIVEYYPYY